MHTPLWFTIVSFNAMAAFIPFSALALWRRPGLWPYLLSLFSGLLVAFVDLGGGEVQVPALLLVAFTFFTGFASPSGAWRWGILTGIWIPVFTIARIVVQGAPASSPGESWGSLLALAFAFAGSYGGSLIRTHGTRNGVREHSAPAESTTSEGNPGR